MWLGTFYEKLRCSHKFRWYIHLFISKLWFGLPSLALEGNSRTFTVNSRTFPKPLQQGRAPAHSNEKLPTLLNLPLTFAITCRGLTSKFQISTIGQTTKISTLHQSMHFTLTSVHWLILETCNA